MVAPLRPVVYAMKLHEPRSMLLVGPEDMDPTLGGRNILPTIQWLICQKTYTMYHRSILL